MIGYVGIEYSYRMEYLLVDFREVGVKIFFRFRVYSFDIFFNMRKIRKIIFSVSVSY